MIPPQDAALRMLMAHRIPLGLTAAALSPLAALGLASAKWRYASMAGQRKPNLFLIGAMKSGTTYLNKLLGAHPAIFMCCPEEPSYFVDPRQLRALWPEAWDCGFWRSEENYLRLFQTAPDVVLLGEASTSYTKRPLVSGVPERIRSFNPDARFIYLLRDPVERTISHYWHMVWFHAERRRILEAVRSEPQYLDISYYAMQVRPYLELFGRERVAVLTFEQLTAAPVPTMQSLYGWLGLDGSTADISGFEEAENVTPEVLRMASGYGVLRRLQKSRPLRYLMPWLPAIVRQVGLRLATKPVRRRAVATTDTVDFLRPIQRQQTEELMQLLGRDFPEWATLDCGNAT
jgi:hypothetical protein